MRVFTKPMFWGWAGSALVLLVAIWLGFKPACFRTDEAELSCTTSWKYLKLASPNEVGDTLAGFAGTLAFIWIIVTVAMQATELREQRKVSILQKKEFEKSNQNLEQQRFEAMFFEMLRTFNALVEEIDVERDYGEGQFTGRDAFGEFVRRLKRDVRLNTAQEHPSAFFFVNRDFWRATKPELGHYFRFLYNLFRFVDESPHATDLHAKIARSCLSDNELLVLFYNSQTEIGMPFKEYINKFSLFDNLPVEKVFHQDHVKGHELSAYGANYDAITILEPNL